MVRVFLAVPLPKKVKENVSTKVNEIKNSLNDWEVNWVSPTNLHVTLIFFGWIEENQLETLRKEVASAVKDFPSFEISTGELNTRNRPIWFEIEEGKSKLSKLQERIAKQLTIKGPEGSRSFHPHLTIGRVKKRGKSAPKETSEPFSWNVNQLILYESKLRKTGSVYSKLETFQLAKKV